MADHDINYNHQHENPGSEIQEHNLSSLSTHSLSLGRNVSSLRHIKREENIQRERQICIRKFPGL